jgi:hypothetical protein
MSTALEAERSPAVRLRSPALPWLALAALVVLTGVFLYHETRGTTIWLDEWSWALQRRGGGLASLLDPHNEHLVLIPVAIYKLLFATAGLGNYAPYRVIVTLAHLACGVLVFAYARTRVGAVLALCAAGSLLLFGPGWENILWPFQMAMLISLAAGLGALMVLDRRSRRGDIAACVLLAISIASSGIGVAFLIGIALELALGRRRWDCAWIVAVPLVLYIVWWIGYQHSSFHRHDILVAPSFLVTGLATTLSALFGLGGATGFDGLGTLETWGPALLIAALALIVWRVARLRTLRPRAVCLAVILLSFWLLTAFSRAFLTQPYASRYLYIGAFLTLLLAVELAMGLAPRWPVKLAIAVVAAGAIVSNIGAIRNAGRLIRAEGQVTSADLGALEIARPVTPPGYIARGIPGYPFVVVPAAAYFRTAAAIGTPAASETTIVHDPESVRAVVDSELIRAHGIALRPSVRTGAGLPCLTVAHRVLTTVPPGGLLLKAAGAPATVAIRRFADAYSPLGAITPGRPVTLQIAPDRSPKPWQIQLVPGGALTACTLAAP